jgi:pimeloyl-ACP methyl ester carboxylesterase
MSFFDYHGKRVFYTVDGVGKPILILNGIMMSTRSWTPFVPSLSEANMLIRVDFLDQGQSDKLPGETYGHDLQVELLHELCRHLGLERINVVGISYGGEIGVELAIAHPDLVERLVVFNTGSYTSPWLRDIGRAWIATGRTRNGDAYYDTAIPVIYSPHYYEERSDWMERRRTLLVPIFSDPGFLDAMERLTLSSESYDVRKTLSRLKARTLIVSAEEDYLTPVADQADLHARIPGSEWIKIPVAGHASMYERPLLFTTLVLGFVNVRDLDYSI